MTIVNLQRFLNLLTIINFILLAALLTWLFCIKPPVLDNVVPVLRGHALEISDRNGKVRASIRMHPAKDAYPDTVMFRLIDPNGRPEVKIGASETGAGIGLIGGRDEVQVLLQAEGEKAFLRFRQGAGQQKVIGFDSP